MYRGNRLTIYHLSGQLNHIYFTSKLFWPKLFEGNEEEYARKMQSKDLLSNKQQISKKYQVKNKDQVLKRRT